MKKFLLMLLMICFTCLVSDAASVYYSGGVPVRYSSGNGLSRSIHRYGTNAAFAPHNVRRASVRQRQIRRYNAITKAIENSGRRGYGMGYGMGGYGGGYSMSRMGQRAYVAEQPSRFSKDFVIKPQKSYTRNGITYYN